MPGHREKESYSSDYSKEPKILVEFRLAKTAHGTLLTVIESGLEDIPRDRRLEAFPGMKAAPSRWKNIDKQVREKT